MTLILDEEFVARPLSNIWLQYDAPDNTINNESSYYTPTNLVLNTGTINGQPRNWLSLQLNRGYTDPYTGTKYNYSGAGIQIQDSRYIIIQGRAEVEARFPQSNQGLIGYILLWPADQSWPPEIDFAETTGSNANYITFTQHWGPNDNTNEYDYNPPGFDITQWHIYAVEVDATKKQLRWYIDNVLITTQTINFSLSRTWLFSAGTWACNCADYCGCPTNAVLPQSLDLAYVKLWDAIPTPPTLGVVSGNVKDLSSSNNLSGVTVSASPTLTTTSDSNGNYTISNVPAGAYTVTASKNCYANSTNPVNVTAGNISIINFLLALNTGSIVCNTTTGGNVLTGAEIWLAAAGSGNYLDQKVVTPSTLSCLPPSNYDLKFTLSAYKDCIKPNNSVTAGSTISVICAMIPTTPIYGTISGNIKDSSLINLSSVIVSNGTSSATTDSNGNYTISNVPPGTYTVTASKNCYTTSTSIPINVTIGNISTVNFTLTLNTGSIACSTTTVTGNPLTGAEVWLATAGSNYIDQGVKTPATLSCLIPSYYDLKFTLSGYKDCIKSNNSVTAGSTLPVSCVMTTTVTNLVRNFGFENGTGSGTYGVPTYWSKYNEGSVPTSPYRWPETGMGGIGYSASVNFGPYIRTGRSVWVQSLPIVAIVGNTSYAVSASIKLSNVIASGTNNGAVIIIDWFRTSGWISSSQVTYVTGNLDWKGYSSIVTSPPGAVRANVLVGLNHCSGKAYFDNIIFYKT